MQTASCHTWLPRSAVQLATGNWQLLPELLMCAPNLHCHRLSITPTRGESRVERRDSLTHCTDWATTNSQLTQLSGSCELRLQLLAQTARASSKCCTSCRDLYCCCCVWRWSAPQFGVWCLVSAVCCASLC